VFKTRTRHLNLNWKRYVPIYLGKETAKGVDPVPISKRNLEGNDVKERTSNPRRGETY